MGITAGEGPKGLEFASAFHGLEDRDFIRVLDVRASGDACRDSSHLDVRTLEDARQVVCRRLAFDGGVGGQDDLVDVAGIDALSKVSDAQVLGADTVQR